MSLSDMPRRKVEPVSELAAIHKDAALADEFCMTMCEVMHRFARLNGMEVTLEQVRAQDGWFRLWYEGQIGTSFLMRKVHIVYQSDYKHDMKGV